MATHQDQYDDAMFAFSTGDYDAAIEGLKALLTEEPSHFDAQLALGMAYYRKEDYPTAITEGHKAEKLKPDEQLVHTNLSLFYMKSGDKETAEHHGLQARIASWKGNMEPPSADSATDPDLQIAPDRPPAVKPPEKFPDMPWKKNPPVSGGSEPATPAAAAAPATTTPETGAESELEFVSVMDPTSLAPGAGRTVDVRGREFAVYNIDGQFYALDDACPHRGGPLGAGTYENGHIYCPLHAWGFDPKTGACQERPDQRVQTHPTRIENGQVQIGLPAKRN